MARKTAFQRFKESLTEEQHSLLKQSSEEAKRERPEVMKRQRQYVQNMAPVKAEYHHVFQLLMGLRSTQKMTMAELSERTGVAKDRLAALENDPDPLLSIEMLANIAQALGHELRISIGRSRVTAPLRRRKAAANA